MNPRNILLSGIVIIQLSVGCSGPETQASQSKDQAIQAVKFGPGKYVSKGWTLVHHEERELIQSHYYEAMLRIKIDSTHTSSISSINEFKSEYAYGNINGWRSDNSLYVEPNPNKHKHLLNFIARLNQSKSLAAFPIGEYQFAIVSGLDETWFLAPPTANSRP
jgi:hypothetical protein